MIVATAGHVDHGKTALVRALTGVDTDRLPEEKRRGISIDLGFAYWRAADDALIGFVDVPGHERFVRNMLAGVCGIDAVLLVVAADDGVMPQTVEHLSIIELLAVERGIAVINKIDRVSPRRVEEVAANLRALLAPTRIAQVQILPVSAKTGEGLETLRDALAALAQRAARQSQEGPFRFAIDRAFSIAGAGTVVTGTAFNGSVGQGDRLVLTPSGVPVRVRGLQKDGKPATRAVAGERCAINLADVDVPRAGRGDWLVAEGLHAPTRRMDVRLNVLRSERSALRHWTPVHLHHGAGDVTARVAIKGEIAPGGTAIAQLVTDDVVAALHGDRFVIRDQSALRTVGGGRVIDPFAPRRSRDRARAAGRAAGDRDRRRLPARSPRCAMRRPRASTWHGSRAYSASARSASPPWPRRPGFGSSASWCRSPCPEMRRKAWWMPPCAPWKPSTPRRRRR